MQQDSSPTLSTRWDSSWPKSASRDESGSLFAYLEERFGIPHSQFRSGMLFKHRQSWWFLKGSPSIALPSRLKVHMVGMKAFQKVGAFVKPTTRFIQAIGSKATRSRLELCGERLQELLKKGTIDLPDAGLEEGYVILCLGDYVLGLGLYIRGRLKSQIPRKHLEYFDADRQEVSPNRHTLTG